MKREISQEIPKLVWQTAKSFPHVNSHPLIKSIITLNPDYEWLFMDDDRCNQFIKDNFNSDFYNMYNSLPFGVMKADVWRVAVVYVYGGVYVDIDCECSKPFSEWLNEKDKLIVAIERENGSLCNFAFASSPKNPVLLSVLNNFMKLYNSDLFLDKSQTTPIQNFGQLGFSDGILEYYNMTGQEHTRLGGTSNYYNENANVQADNTKFILKQDNIFTPHKYASTCIFHCSASIKWRNDDYDSWRNQEKEYLK